MPEVKPPISKTFVVIAWKDVEDMIKSWASTRFTVEPVKLELMNTNSFEADRPICEMPEYVKLEINH